MYQESFGNIKTYIPSVLKKSIFFNVKPYFLKIDLPEAIWLDFEQVEFYVEKIDFFKTEGM